MAESSHNSLLMKKSNEEKLNAIITSFGKSEPNVLRFSEVLFLLLDRCIFSNRLSFRKFVQLFDQASKVTVKFQRKQSLPSQPPTEPPVATTATQRHLARQQLIFFVGELGKHLYPNDKNYLERIFQDLLTQTSEADEDNEMINARVLTMDETDKKLIVEQSITTIANYEKDLRGLFNCYVEENYQAIKKDKRLLLTEREINLQNKKMFAFGLIAFLREAEICPHVISIDHVQDIMRLVVPYTDSKQNEFYHKRCLQDAYSNQQHHAEKWKNVTDPGLMFFEFQFLVARIAWQSFPKDQDKKGVDSVLERFFQKVLSIRNVENQKSELVPYKKHLVLLKEYWDKYAYAEEITAPKQLSVVPEKDPRLAMAEKHEMEIDHMPMATVDIQQMLKALEKELPKLPPPPKINQQNPPPYKDERIVIGQVPPPEEKEVDKGGKGQAKKDAGKKDEQPARVFPWASAPTPIKSSQDYFQQLATKLTFQTQPLSSLSRGIIPRTPPPSLISQTLFPPELPLQVQPFILGARTCLLDRNYFLALQNFNKAYVSWKQFYKRKSEDFPQNIQLYFGYMRGSVCASAGKDDHALVYYFNCRKQIQGGKLGFVNPDRALPYFGIGEMLYEIGEYEFATRAFLKAREIREGVLGVEHIQTATVFNNLGACFFMLGRATEALGYLEIAEAVLAGDLGPYHERTMTVRSNLNKIKKGQFQNIPEYRKLWEVYEKDEFEGGKKKKKAGGKKK